jgi:hypothetical protein
VRPDVPERAAPLPPPRRLAERVARGVERGQHPGPAALPPADGGHLVEEGPGLRLEPAGEEDDRGDALVHRLVGQRSGVVEAVGDRLVQEQVLTDGSGFEGHRRLDLRRHRESDRVHISE